MKENLPCFSKTPWCVSASETEKFRLSWIVIATDYFGVMFMWHEFEDHVMLELPCL